MNIRDLIEEQSSRRGTKPAVVFRGEPLSFSRLAEETRRLAGTLTHLGTGAAEKTALFLPNCPEYIYGYFAVFSLGGVVVPLDFMLTDNELISFIQHSQSSVLIARARKGIDLAAIKRSCPGLKHVILLDDVDGSPEAPDGFVSYRRAVSSVPQNPPVRPDVADSDPAAIFYTSGSTGRPKGVLLTYGHLDNPVASITHFLAPTADDSYLCAGIPFSHVGGLDYILFMLSFGATLVLMERFHPLEALKNIEKHGIRIFCIVPSMFVALLSLKECEKFDLSSLRHLAVFGAPSSPALLKRFHQLCPNARLSNGWGMTETAAPNTYSPDDVAKINSIGPFGVGMEARIVDETGRDLPDGRKGELWVRGKAVMAGYFNDEALTRQVLTPEGWLRTGDVAWKDPDGNFYLSGRIKEMIKVAGEIVMAPEVEDIFHRHPDVRDAAVIGVPDKMRGEAPKAFVVLKDDARVTTDELKYFLREHLAHFKIPHDIELRGSLPKNRAGKIDKEILRRETASMPS